MSNLNFLIVWNNVFPFSGLPMCFLVSVSLVEEWTQQVVWGLCFSSVLCVMQCSYRYFFVDVIILIEKYFQELCQ